MSKNCMLFTGNMRLFTSYNLFKTVLFGLIALALSCSKEQDVEFTERAKIALRDVGNQLLLKTNDSTSLIKPVIEIESKKFQLAFTSELNIEPNDIVLITQQSLNAAKLPKYYRVEVIQCVDGEVAYSYQISAEKESTLIPCVGRELPVGCYFIEVKFTKNIAVPFTRQGFFYGYVALILFLLLLYFYKKRQAFVNDTTIAYTIGSYKFYPDQNKLVKAADEISLSKKECELLAIFVDNPNTIIKRDELTKRVWEDHGVIVGRSLDTYISKLRKKLQEDDSIKLTNVHGIGYKLEMD